MKAFIPDKKCLLSPLKKKIKNIKFYRLYIYIYQREKRQKLFTEK